MKNRDERVGWKARANKWITRLAVVMVTFGVVVASADAAVGKLHKLEKKLAKVEASIVAKQALVDAALVEIPIQEQALSDGQDAQVAAALLPRTTKAEKKVAKAATKAANKAVQRATKRINKLTQKVAKLNKQIAKKLLKVAALEQSIDKIVIGGLPGEGEIGVEGLEAPAQMTMVAAAIVDDGPTSNDQDVGQGDPSPPAWVAGLSVPGQSDYFADESQTWTYDPSMESLDTVNSILQMMRQTAFDAMVNEGAYIAQIDPNLSSSGGSVGGQQGQSQQVELWTVNSQRQGATKQHVVGAWVPQEFDDGPGTIRARMVIIEEPSENNPYGVFAMDFEGVSDADLTGQATFWGTLQSEDAANGVTGFSYYETSGVKGSNDFSERAVHLSINANGEGVANVFETVTGDFGPAGSTQTEQDTFLLAFDQNNVLRQQGASTPVCLDRNSIETSVWRYNLYEASGPDVGTLVTRNSGFGIATTNGDYGWAGYNGLWLPPASQVISGDTVVKNTVDSGDFPEQFTVMRAPGKLLRYTQSTLGLAGIDGMQFEWFGIAAEVEPLVGQAGSKAYEGSTGAGFILDTPMVTNYLVQFSYGTGEFTAIGKFDDDHQFTAMYPNVVLDTEALGFLDMWSSALGGSVAYVYGSNEVTFFVEEIVSGNDGIFGVGGTVQLFAYVGALDSGITGVDAANGDVFLRDVTDVATPYSFVMDRDDLTLYHDVMGNGSVLDKVGLGVGETYDSGPFYWGMRSGPMVTDTGGLVDALDVWSQDVFYVYETGPNDWNMHTTLINGAGDFVDFAAPLQFTYTHSTAQDRNGSIEHDGQVFQLEFSGPGELQGIPVEGVDTDGDGNDDRWYPVFDLTDGTLVGPEGSEFLVRAIEMEQRLATNVSGCTALNLAGASVLTLPDGSEFEQPNLGNEPVVSGPPAVITGVVQEE